MNSKELYDATTGERLYTVREAARLLGYHPFSVYRLVCLGKIRHRRLGPKTLLFSREDLLRYQERLEAERPRRGRPLAREAAGEPMSARLRVELEGGSQQAALKQFRWESIPLIRARLDSQYGKRLRGLRISVRAGIDEVWKVIYVAPKA